MPRRRRLARWAVLLGCLPVLALVVAGVYSINLVSHTQRAVDRIAQPSIADIVHGTSLPDVRPTNTPDARGTSIPLPTLVPAPTALTVPRFDRKDPFTIMLLGVEDQRNGPDDLSRSDTIILVYVDPAERYVNLLSIPRDLRVTEPNGLGQAKMADVFAHGDQIKYKGVGGIALVWDTIEQTFQIKIDYYVRANFDGFTTIINTVGGVTVDNLYPIKDDAYPTEDFQFARVFFPAGIVHLDGAEALKYVRTRHDDSDFARNARQQQVILAVREQAVKLNLLTKATDLIDATGDAFRTDFPRDQWLGLATFGMSLPRDAIHQFSLTDLLANETIGGIYYAGIVPQDAAARARQFSPKENFPAIQAQAQRDSGSGLVVTVENGTRTVGLANRWATVLQNKGFGKAGFIDAPLSIKGTIGQTHILFFGTNRDAAIAIASVLGIDPNSVPDRPGSRPAEVPPQTDILVVLGNDAREPG